MPHRDDTLTIVAIASLGCVQQDLLHEGLGHGVTAWLSGASSITISTVALQSDISTRWISANGTLVNIAAGAVSWAALRAKALRPATRYFLVLAMAGSAGWIATALVAIVVFVLVLGRGIALRS